MKTDVENLNQMSKGVLVYEDPDGYQNYINKRKIVEKNTNEIKGLEARISRIESSIDDISTMLKMLLEGQSK